MAVQMDILLFMQVLGLSKVHQRKYDNTFEAAESEMIQFKASRPLRR
jgi:Tfp pilus assembly protein PilV